MKFNFENYKGDYCMHCKTEEEAIEFCKLMNKDGRNWSSGCSYLNHNNWEVYKDETVYTFNIGGYTYIDFAKNNRYTILEWSDFKETNFKYKAIVKIYVNNETFYCEFNVKDKIKTVDDYDRVINIFLNSSFFKKNNKTKAIIIGVDYYEY